MGQDFGHLQSETRRGLTVAGHVTVLVPSFNHGKYIRERIDSILGQTYQDFDLVVIDDRSSDDSDQIIKELQSRHGFRYLRNETNSGTPFAAWERIGEIAHGEFIWVCESDDVAEPHFLETAIRAFEKNPQAVLFYSNSLVIDQAGVAIGHTETYFRETWKESRWDHDFVVDGPEELRAFQMRGQIVPNMSSAVIRTDAFRQAFRPFLKQLKLTGDWLFIGDVLSHGDAIFCHQALSRFRKHEVTARVRVKSARSQAEFILTKYLLFRSAKCPQKEFATLMGPDVVRFLYEPASLWAVFRALLSISLVHTLGAVFLLMRSMVFNRHLLEKFMWRLNHSRNYLQGKHDGD
jgi:glycosyltransferase involved in cell wall biosynthesis